MTDPWADVIKLITSTAKPPRSTERDEIDASLHAAALVYVDAGATKVLEIALAVLNGVVATWPEDRRPSAETIQRQAAWLLKVDPDAALAEPDPPPPTEPPPDKPEEEEPEDVERGDIANASRFVAMHGKVVRYCAVFDRWHVWDGKVWQEDDDGAVMRLAELTAKQIAREFLMEAKGLSDEADAVRKEVDEENTEEVERAKGKAIGIRKRAQHIAAKAEQIQSIKKMRDMIDLVKSREAVAVDPADLDSHGYLINFQNGVVDMRDGRVYPHKPSYLMTKICAVDYEPKASQKVLKQVLDNVCNGDQAMITYAQDVIGRSLFGDNALEQFWIWQGPGGSGKGTLFEGLKAAMGGYCMTAEFQSFIKVQGHRVRDDLARLSEARVVLASEVEKGEVMAAGVIKAMTANDTVSARQLYGSYFEFRPRLTLHLQCNDLPRADDQDSGIWRRIVVMPCGPTIPDDQRDPGVKLNLLDPKRGGKAIMAWAIAGAIRSHSALRLIEPPVVKAASQSYRSGQDPVKEFFQDALLFALPTQVHDQAGNPMTFCTVADLVKTYHTWGDEQGLNPKMRVSPRSMADRLEARGCYRHKIRVGADGKPTSCWVGVALDTMDKLKDTCAGQTFRPSREDHEKALESVPAFLCSGGFVKSSHACAPARSSTNARARDQVDTLLNSKNTGTEEQEKKEKNSEGGGQQSLDLTDLGGGPGW